MFHSKSLMDTMLWGRNWMHLEHVPVCEHSVSEQKQTKKDKITYFMDITFETSHPEMSWSKVDASLNM